MANVRELHPSYIPRGPRVCRQQLTWRLASAVIFFSIFAPLTTAAEPETTDKVVSVRIVGNQIVSESKILSQIQTRAGRNFDPQIIQKDVRELATRGNFLDVEPSYQRVPGGLAVIFKVSGRPTLRYVRYLGIRKVKSKTLAKQTRLKVGDAVDPYAIDEGRRKIEQHYRDKGFNKVQVEVIEGNKVSDHGATYVISEGPQERIWDIDFVGNTIVSDAVLQTKIKSRSVFRNPFKSYVDRQMIDQDVDLLTAYYRSLGYFQARVSRDPDFDEKGWLTLTFVIDEGPRFKIRDVSFLGNEKFSTDTLATDLKLTAGEFFDQRKLKSDLSTLRDFFGSQGYVFADVQADPRYHEESPELDLVYHVKEGKRYRVGEITVNITGDHPHTRIQTVLNRLSLKPGDWIDITKVRADERRIIASQFFENDPARGITPKIVFQPPDPDSDQIADDRSGRNRYRGQSPDQSVIEHRRVPHQANYRPTGSDEEEDGDDAVLDILFDIDILIDSRATGADHRPASPRREPDESSGPNGAAVPWPAIPLQPIPLPGAHGTSNLIIRGQSPEPSDWASQPSASASSSMSYGGFVVQQLGPGGQTPASSQRSVYARQLAYDSRSVYDKRSAPQPGDTSGLRSGPIARVAYQANSAPNATGPVFAAPPLQAPGAVPSGGSLLLGDPQGQFPLGADGAYDYELLDPTIPLIVDDLQETQTGRLQVGVGVNSDAGMVGSILIHERNFDWRRWPTSFEDIRNGTAWRGGGQNFRIELAPGTLVQRYLVSWGQPYLFDSLISMNLSGFLFDRRYRNWDEQRLGGRVSLGYQLAPDLSTIFTYRGENVKIHDVAAGAPQQLLDVVGDNVLHGFKGTLVQDTRDSAFLPTMGHLINLSFEQVIGTWDYQRSEVDVRQYFLIHQRPDGSGRHVISLSSRLGVASDNTPIYDHFFAGGYSTLRGFDFRGASPVVGGTIVGGEFMWISSIEYLAPITADDMIRGVVFCDFGTVEPNVAINDFRVAPGFGLRVTMAALGPAPIAFDFAFPVVKADTDDTQVFSFSIGLLR